MNYFLFVVILALCGGAYYTHMQDQQQIANLQSALDHAETNAPATATSATPSGSVIPAAGSTGLTTSPAAAAKTAMANPAPANPTTATPVAPAPAPHPQTMAIIPDNTHSTSIDAAAAAAQAAATAADLGTITTLDNHTYTNCKVIKVEQDGVTFTDDTGITKIEYLMMAPALQKRFGYSAPSSP